MEKDRVSVGAGVTALLLLGAFAQGIFAAAAEPAICPPPFAGDLHPWVSTAALAGLLTGAVFSPQRWQQGLAWGCALTFITFEAAFALPLMDLGTGALPAAGRRFERALQMSAAVGLFFLLLAPALFVEGRRRRNA